MGQIFHGKKKDKKRVERKKPLETSIEKMEKSGNERCGKAWKESARFANEKREWQ